MARSLMIDHAASLLGVSRRTVYYRIREGRLRTMRTLGGSQRVLMESLVALMRDEPSKFGGAPAGARVVFEVTVRGGDESGVDRRDPALARFPWL